MKKSCGSVRSSASNKPPKTRGAARKADTNKDDLKSQEKQPIGSLKQDTVQSKLFCAVFFYVQMY